MNMEVIQEIANVVGGILVSSFVIWQTAERALNNIGWMTRKRKEKEDLARKKRKEEFADTAKTVFQENVTPAIEEIIEHNKEQDKKIALLLESSRDGLRFEIVQIYYKYRKYKRILHYDKEMLIRLYDDYTAQGGNSFITDIMNEVKTWEVVRTIEGITDEAR